MLFPSIFSFIRPRHGAGFGTDPRSFDPGRWLDRMRLVQVSIQAYAWAVLPKFSANPRIECGARAKSMGASRTVAPHVPPRRRCARFAAIAPPDATQASHGVVAIKTLVCYFSGLHSKLEQTMSLVCTAK